MHEIGHAIGFFHEQSRSDRDEHITVLFENMDAQMRGQFEKQDDMNFTVPYDASSVMQYPQWAFSKDVHELNTIITKDPFMQLSLGGDVLTFRDKKLANAMYECDGKCSSVELFVFVRNSAGLVPLDGLFPGMSAASSIRGLRFRMQSVRKVTGTSAMPHPE